MEENDDGHKTDKGSKGLMKDGLIVFCLSCHIIIVATNHTGPTFFNYTPPFKCKGYEENPCHLSINRTLKTETGFNSSYLSQNEVCPSDYEYLGGKGEVTVVTEWNLVCDRVVYNALSITCYFIAVALGSLISGVMNDHCGRKFTTYFCIYAQSIIALLTSFAANSYLIYIILRFVQGLFIQGILTGTSLLINEIMPKMHRIILNGILEIFWGAGLILLAECAFFFPNWRILNAIICVIPLFVALCSVWFVPESKIWLKSRKSKMKEMDIRENRRKVYIDETTSSNQNKAPIAVTGSSAEVTVEDGVDKITSIEKSKDIDGSEEKQELLNATDKQLKTDEHNQTELLRPEENSTFVESGNLLSEIKLLFSVTTLLKRLLLMLLLWFTQTISYYGITYTLPMLAGDLYVNFILGAFVEIFFFVLIGAATYKFGRRFTLSCSYFGSGICFLLIVVLPTGVTWAGVLKTSLAIAGKGCVIGNYICIMLYNLELFPTQLRGLCLGLSHFCALVGTIVAPFAILLNNYFTAVNVPFLLFAILNFVCNILGFTLLPETKDCALPETIEEALLLKR